jgi:error-prone DNA polymerase
VSVLSREAAADSSPGRKPRVEPNLAPAAKRRQNDDSETVTPLITAGDSNPKSKIQNPKSEEPFPLPSSLSTGRESDAMRLGFRLIKGFRQADAETLVTARRKLGAFRSIEEIHQATGLKKAALRKLAEADAFSSLKLSRREALWQVMALSDEQMPLYAMQENRHEGTEARRHEVEEGSSLSPCLRASVPSCLPPMPLSQQVLTDYCTTGLSLKQHPVALVREALTKQKVITAKEMTSLPHGRFVRVAGMVLIRQRPGTASGIVFITLEDETGIANLIVRPNTFDQYRPAARHAALLQCDGYVERQGQVVHVMAKRLFDRSELIAGMEFSSRDFH